MRGLAVPVSRCLRVPVSPRPRQPQAGGAPRQLGPIPLGRAGPVPEKRPSERPPCAGAALAGGAAALLWDRADAGLEG